MNEIRGAPETSSIVAGWKNDRSGGLKGGGNVATV